MLEKYHQYIEDVLSGKELVCRLTRLAVERQVKDLERQEQDDYPYYFDENAAATVIRFVKSLRHVAGKWAGQLFDPEPDQVFKYAVIFGWKNKETKKRRFRRVYMEVARKNGKSFDASVIELVGLLLDGEARAEIYSAATTRDQAGIVFEVSKDILRRLIKDSPAIEKRIKVYAHSIVNVSTGGRIGKVSSDAGKLDGLSPSMWIVDEYHEHPTDKVLKVGETGMGAREQPLSVVITTAGFNITGPCYDLRKTAVQILEGLKTDDAFFSVIYTIDEDDDWNDEAVWKKSNPHIGISPSWEFMRAEYTRAKNEGSSAEVQFLTKNLNVWTSSKATWVQDDKWMKCATPVDLEALDGARCWAGLDLGEVFDFTAFCLVFGPETENDTYKMAWWFWIPEEAAALFESRGHGAYRQWADDGHITITPGNVVDLDYVISDIADIGKRYKIETVGIDPWGSKTNVLKLQEIGMSITEVRQGYRTLSPPMKDFERLIMTQQIAHGGNPVMRWMMSNVNAVRDPAGNIKPDRSSKENKIDGVVAAIMALGLAIDGAKPAQLSYLFDDETDLITI
ncbi:MAG TPA: terminase large subunit [bacterium]|nr:terminase large subunit [bacterium]HNH33991.1 terminase large subunit [bacterium]